MQQLKTYSIALLLMLQSSVACIAQPGLSEFNSLTNEVNRYYFNFSDLSLVIGAICGLLGGIRLFNNWQMGKERIDAQLTGWFMSCIFLSLISAALKGLFH